MNGLDATTRVVHRIVVMGVAGSGKTTVGIAVADELDLAFVDGDSLHPPANVAKMSAGEPLDDDDRRPWLAAVLDQLCRSDGIVVACSALKRSYRDVVRQASGTRFVFLDLDADQAVDRAARRAGHFMGPSMIASQFASLERPDRTETDIVHIDARQPVELVVRDVVAELSRPPASR